MTPCCLCGGSASVILLTETPTDAQGLLCALVCSHHKREVGYLLMSRDHPLVVLPINALSDIRTLRGAVIWELHHSAS